MKSSKIFLIIDDDADDRDFFSDALAAVDTHAKCNHAYNGEDALAKLKDKNLINPDYIFLDLNMPRMDGRTFLSRIKTESSLKDIPVIIFTTSSNPNDVTETLELGAAHYITKPYEFKKMCEQIQLVIDKF